MSYQPISDKQAARDTEALWRTLQTHPNLSKMEAIRIYPTLKHIGEYTNCCPCCQYVVDTVNCSGGLRCDLCPLKHAWNSFRDFPCESKDSPYRQFCTSSDLNAKTAHAKTIADAAQKWLDEIIAKEKASSIHKNADVYFKWSQAVKALRITSTTTQIDEQPEWFRALWDKEYKPYCDGSAGTMTKITFGDFPYPSSLVFRINNQWVVGEVGDYLVYDESKNEVSLVKPDVFKAEYIAKK